MEDWDVPPEALLALDTLRRQDRSVATARADSHRQEKSKPSSCSSLVLVLFLSLLCLELESSW